jgi:hypothetical protein
MDEIELAVTVDFIELALRVAGLLMGPAVEDAAEVGVARSATSCETGAIEIGVAIAVAAD